MKKFKKKKSNENLLDTSSKNRNVQKDNYKIKMLKLRMKKENLNSETKRRKTTRQILQNKLKKQIEKQDNNKEINRLKKKKPLNYKKLNKNNIDKIEPIGSLSRVKRIRIELLISILILVILTGRLGFLQFIKGTNLQDMAFIQQTLDRKINPKRGTIYDATGKNILAVSSTVESVTINPTNIEKEDKERVAKALAEIFELDYEKVLKRVSKRSSIENIVKKVDKEKTDKLRIWMKENNIEKGINIDEDTKRYYPYNNLASQIIGFCGSDNQGLDGIEAVYDNELKGEKGSISKITDAKGGEINNSSESYFNAIDGNDLILTIDVTIQGIAEKYLKEACIDNKCTDGGNITIMNPQNGDILAIAGYPNYN